MAHIIDVGQPAPVEEQEPAVVVEWVQNLLNSDALQAMELLSVFNPHTWTFALGKGERLWVNVLSAVMTACNIAYEDEDEAGLTAAWKLLLLLPRLIFQQPEVRERNRASIVKERLSMLRAGRLLELLAATEPRPPKIEGNSSLKQEQLKRAIRKASKGELADAVAALQAAAPLANTPTTIEALRAKHPAAKEEPLAPQLLKSERAVFKREHLAAVMRRLKKDKAPGISGMRYEHLLHLHAIGTGRQQDHFAEFIGHLAQDPNGFLPNNVEFRRHFWGARLTALGKSSPGVRPIQASDVLHRVVAKCAARSTESRVSRHVTPIQRAVGLAGGAESVVHQIQLDAENNPTFVTVTLDITNAYNEIKRNAIRCQIQELIPEWEPFFNASHCNPYLTVTAEDGEVVLITAEEGTSQGGPFSPIEFCLAIDPVLKAINKFLRKRSAQCSVTAFLDNITLRLPPRLLDATFTKLVPRLNALGLSLNMRETKVLGRQEQRLRCQPFCNKWEVEFIDWSTGIRLLGVPIGRISFVQSYLEAAIEPYEQLLADICSVPAFQLRLLLLRHCAMGTHTHLLRGLPPSLTQKFARAVDRLVAERAAELHGVDALTAHQLKRIHMPVKKGGLGLTSAEETREAAFAASMASFFQLARKLSLVTGQFLLRAQQREANPLSRDLHAASERLKTVYNSKWNLFSASVVDAPKKIQMALTRGKRKETLKKWMSADNDNKFERVALASLTAKDGHAGAWLHAIPTIRALTLDNDEVSDRLRHRLCIFQPVDPGVSCRCRRPINEHHDQVCSVGGALRQRHDSLVSVVSNLLRTGGLSTQVEPPNLLPNAPDERRGDLLVRDFNERDTLMDIAVTHPLKDRERSLRTSGWARIDMESRKRTKYEEYAEMADLKFLPVVWDAYGAAAEGACHVLKIGAEN
jgi:hypothetical protein